MSAGSCVGFQWCGQDFAHCEGCGRDIREHEGLSWRKELLSFEDATARIPMFAYYVTPIGGGRPYRWEREPTSASPGETRNQEG